jgi:hypothetical protein
MLRSKKKKNEKEEIVAGSEYIFISRLFHIQNDLSSLKSSLKNIEFMDFNFADRATRKEDF